MESRNILYVGLDWSNTSPSMVVRNKSFIDNDIVETEYIHYCISFENKDKFFSQSPFDFLKVWKLTKKEIDKKNGYSKKENDKLSNYVDIVNLFSEEINRLSNIFLSDKIKVGLEGWSYSSNGASGLDLACSQGMLRKSLLDIDKLELNFFAPTEIKKFAGKGNYSKIEMVEALIKKFPTEKLSTVLNENKHLWLTKSNVIKKPIDDIVDATWLCKIIENE